MIVRMNSATALKILNTMFNAGAAVAIFDAATAEFRTGVQPADGNDASTGIVVATVALPADAMQAAVDVAGVVSIAKTATVWQDLLADANGTITWTRFWDATHVYSMDFDCTGSAGAGAIKIDNPVVLAGQAFTVTDFTLVQPRST